MSLAAVGGLFAGLGLLEADAKKRKKQPDQESFTVVAPNMTGANEVPGPEDPPDAGDLLGHGTAECTIKGTEIRCDFTFMGR